MKNTNEMTREQFMELFGYSEFDAGIETADGLVDEGATYFEVAKSNIEIMHMTIKSLSRRLSK